MNNVQLVCKINGEMIQQPILSDMLGVPIATDIVSKLTCDILLPSEWNTESIQEWFNGIYSNCLQTTYTGSHLTPDRVLCTLQSPENVDTTDDENNDDNNDDDDNNDNNNNDDDDNNDNNNNDDTLVSKEQNTSGKATLITKQSIVIVGTFESDNTDTESLLKKEIQCIADSYQIIYDFHKSAFFILTDSKCSMDINQKLHHIQKKHKQESPHFQTFMMNVQHTEKIGTHITHIEVVV